MENRNEQIKAFRAYTIGWLRAIAKEPKFRGNQNIFAYSKSPKSFGHGFYSGIWGTKVKQSRETEAVYYALCIVAQILNRHSWRRWETLFDFLLSAEEGADLKQPGFLPDDDITPVWNLYNALRMLEDRIKESQ